MIIVHFENTLFYQQIVEKKSFSIIKTIVAEHLQWLWRNIGMNTISVASIRGQIRRDIKFCLQNFYVLVPELFQLSLHPVLKLPIKTLSLWFADYCILHAVCSVYHSHAVISKCTLIIFNKNAISFAQFIANGPLFLRSFGDLQQRLNHLQLV
jgi:hypothetical protein